jgi:CP family cyanate transporter-like MFS transporter
VWKSGHAWSITLFVGMQSLEYYSVLTWLPSMLTSQGVSIATSGWLLALVNWCGIPASLAVPYLCQSGAMVRPLAIACSVGWGLGLAGLLTGHGVVAATIVLGLAQGGSVSLGLSLVALKSAGGVHTVALSGMAQALGYVLASVGPVAVGSLFSLTGSWTTPLACLLCGVFVLLVAGIVASAGTRVERR